MAKQEFLSLAQTYKDQAVPGWFVSEKLDGMRCFWDGGITRGMDAELVPWANNDKSTGVSTGLWSRYGKIIYAPSDWLDKLPLVPLDGELYLGRGTFQSLVSITKRHEPDARWADVQYVVFDSPPMESIFGDRRIDGTMYKKTYKGIVNWLRTKGQHPWLRSDVPFAGRYKALAKLAWNDTVVLLEQEQLPFSTYLATVRLEERLLKVTDQGGEGIMLKNPSSLWLPERTWSMLKMKPFHDAEATVIGYTAGEATDKGSKLRGLMGALILKSEAGVFKLSGFTDLERKMTFVDSGESAFNYVHSVPGQELQHHVHNPMFPRGSTVTFKFRELTQNGLPKEARFWRKHE